MISWGYRGHKKLPREWKGHAGVDNYRRRSEELQSLQLHLGEESPEVVTEGKKA